jgi:predicted MFS family arabinose efflux permease
VCTGFVYTYLVVYLHEARGIPLASAGIAMALLAAGSLALNLASGPVVDRLGPRRVLVALLLLGAVGVLALALVRETWQAFLVAPLIAAGTMTSWVGLQPLLASVVPAERRADAFAVQFAILNAGIGAGGLIAGFVVDYDRPGTFTVLYVAAAALYLSFAMLLLCSPGLERAQPARARGARGGYRAVARDRAFRGVWLLNAFLVLVGTGQLENAFPAFATDVAGISPRVLGIAFAANTFTIVAGQFVVLRLVRGRRRTRALVVQSCFWAAAWTTVLLGSHVGSAAFVLAMVLFACGEMLHAPSIPAIVNDLATDELSGRYNAANAVSWQTGRIVGAPLAGLLLGAGLGVPLLVGFVAACGLAAVSALALEGVLPRRANGQRPPDSHAVPAYEAA